MLYVLFLSVIIYVLCHIGLSKSPKELGGRRIAAVSAVVVVVAGIVVVVVVVGICWGRAVGNCWC